MRLRYQYLIVGIAWALLLGPAAFFLLFGFAAGASWLWLFGDSAWPSTTQWALPLIGVTGGSLIALTCVLVAYEYGKVQETQAVTSLRTERPKVIVLAIVPLAILVLIGLRGWQQSRNYARDMEIAAQREAAFASLVDARHRITGITLDRDDHERFRATVHIKGERQGNYRLHWQVADTGFGVRLASEDDVIALAPGEAEAQITFTLNQLVQSYQAKVLKGRTGVLVEEPFELEVWLVPGFRESERMALPPGERRRLDRGGSSLRSQEATRFLVRFFIRAAGSRQ